MLSRSVEWVIFTFGCFDLSAWFSMRARKGFGVQTREPVSCWVRARLSNGAPLWRCFVCFHISPLHPWHYQWELASSAINSHTRSGDGLLAHAASRAKCNSPLPELNEFMWMRICVSDQCSWNHKLFLFDWMFGFKMLSRGWQQFQAVIKMF